MDIEMQASLGLADADRMSNAVVVAAGEMGLKVCVAVVDRAGHLLVAKRMPGSPLHSLGIAEDKAYTAVSFGRPTGQWAERLAPASEMLRHGLLQRPRFAPFGGGLPVLWQGQRVGAIGISGGTEAQDVTLAEVALAALAVLVDH